ncbi:MAG: hypothetical protein E7I45_08410, partial [Eikenella corrodens]|nr:hypothetical protein [Eikenella corrodens]
MSSLTAVSALNLPPWGQKPTGKSGCQQPLKHLSLFCNGILLGVQERLRPTAASGYLKPAKLRNDMVYQRKFIKEVSQTAMGVFVL